MLALCLQLWRAETSAECQVTHRLEMMTNACSVWSLDWPANRYLFCHNGVETTAVHSSTLQIPDPVCPALYPILRLSYEWYDVGGFTQLLMRRQSCGMAFKEFVVLLCKLLARKTSPRE